VIVDVTTVLLVGGREVILKAMQPAEPDLDALRKLSPQAKLAAMRALIGQAYALKLAWVRQSQPDLNEEEARIAARDLVASGRA